MFLLRVVKVRVLSCSKAKVGGWGVFGGEWMVLREEGVVVFVVDDYY